MGFVRTKVASATLIILLSCWGALEVRGQPNETYNFYDVYEPQWSADHIHPLNNGEQVQINLDIQSGAGFQSKSMYTYGYFRMDIKLIPNDSAGTVTAFYLSSGGDKHDEIDFEFLGNVSGQPYILQTNLFANGQGGREQRLFMWFDPTADFHSYAVIWNHAQIVFLVDDSPIRVYKNLQSQGVDYPSYQQLGAYSVSFDGSSWATQGGRVPVDWSKAPFISTYSGFQIDACINDGSGNTPSCATNYQNNWWEGPEFTSLSSAQVSQLESIRQSYFVYDYCTDSKRYPTAPLECAQDYN